MQIYRNTFKKSFKDIDMSTIISANGLHVTAITFNGFLGRKRSGVGGGESVGGLPQHCYLVLRDATFGVPVNRLRWFLIEYPANVVFGVAPPKLPESTPTVGDALMKPLDPESWQYVDPQKLGGVEAIAKYASLIPPGCAENCGSVYEFRRAHTNRPLNMMQTGYAHLHPTENRLFTFSEMAAICQTMPTVEEFANSVFEYGAWNTTNQLPKPMLNWLQWQCKFSLDGRYAGQKQTYLKYWYARKGWSESETSRVFDLTHYHTL